MGKGITTTAFLLAYGVFGFSQTPYVATRADFTMNGDTIKRFRPSAATPTPEWVVIPESLGAKAIKGFGIHYDVDNEEAPPALRHVSIPSTVESIGMGAFCKCRLDSVDLGDGVVKIWNEAFAQSNLRSVRLPENCSFVGAGSFRHNAIESLHLPKCRVRHLSGFRGNKLRRISIPGNVAVVGNYAFAENPIETLDIAEGVDSILGYAFCAAEPLIDGPSVFDAPLKSVKLPSSTVYVGAYAFAHLGNVATIDLGGVESINYGAFMNCRNVRYLKTPPSLRRIGGAAFRRCESLERLELNEGLEEIGKYAFEWCTLTSDLTIPGSARRVGDHAFANMKCGPGLRISTSEGVEEIGEWAFSGRGTDSGIIAPPADSVELSLPRTLRRIGGAAFYGIWIKATRLPTRDDKGQKITWDAYHDGKLAESDVKTIGGRNRTGFNREATYEYVAKTVAKPSAMEVVEPNADEDVTVYDISGREVYRGRLPDVNTRKGLYVIVGRQGRQVTMLPTRP